MSRTDEAYGFLKASVELVVRHEQVSPRAAEKLARAIATADRIKGTDDRARDGESDREVFLGTVKIDGLSSYEAYGYGRSGDPRTWHFGSINPAYDPPELEVHYLVSERGERVEDSHLIGTAESILRGGA